MRAALIFLSLLIGVCTFAQRDTAQKDTASFFNREFDLGSFPKQIGLPLRKLTISGEYRQLVTHRHMSDVYQVDSVGGLQKPRELFVGDDAFLPIMMLRISGSPSSKVSFTSDMFVYSPFNALVDPDGTQNVLSLNLGLALTGSYSTDIGSFAVRTGGIHWYSMTDLTFGTFTGYDRFSAFERNPWDPVDRRVIDRYKGQYEFGGITQDVRWGEQAFKGLILEGSKLPGNMSFSFLYGKAQISAGASPVPDLNIGGQLKKAFNKGGWIAYQTFNRATYSDSLNNQQLGFNMHTLQLNKSIEGFTLNAELGAGAYFHEALQADFGEAMTIKLSSNKAKTGIPLELGFFRIHQNVINNSATFWNSSITEVPSASSGQLVGQDNSVLQPNASSLTSVGQMTNNRQGVTVNGTADIKKLRLNFGLGASKELEARGSQIALNRPATNLIRSRFWRWNFVNNVGPYGNENVIYRGTYELIDVTDSTINASPKAFSTLEMQMRYKFLLGQRETFLVLNSMFATAQQDISVIPVFNDDAIVRSSFAQLEMYRPLGPNVVLAAVYGKEFQKANNATELDAITGLPHDREGTVYGFGFDIGLGKKAGLFLRHRWFETSDKNFGLDKFKGHETMAEIKLLF